LKSYKDVLRSAKEAKTIAAHITALGKIRAKTEDDVLLDKIDKAIGSLQGAHATAKKGKSTPTCLDKAKDLRVKGLIEHCERTIVDDKPEWQVIAERHGWGPKT
jgi:hypothetical protein